MIRRQILNSFQREVVILYNGFKIIESSNIMKSVQTRFPRCNKKKTRITKKFKAKYTKMVPDLETVFKTSDSLIMHPATAMHLRETIRSQHPGTYF